ncbi:MAG: ABC transporter ATP-binding protein [Albidovulum sp.]|nr:ABC transporter ATP-binding protein [Albidovulum sp.]MDE0533487.1 ABC transporter ATP-binding protein [Albidovulum sp.]
MPNSNGPLISVKNLKTVFRTRGGEVHAVNSVSFDLAQGELLGVVGESGSGKSVTMMSLIGLLPTPPAEIRSGQVMFEGSDLLTAEPRELRRIRGGKIGFVFQDPMTSLNPVFTVGFQIVEPLRRHLGLNRAAARKRAAELLELVGIPDPRRRLANFPHQFSGGMRQRVMFAIAIACEPKVLIADEPTTALDVTIQAQIIELVRDLRKNLGMAIVWITHDLGVIAGISDRVIVMYGGQIVEQGPVSEVFSDPGHPYTQALLGTVPAVRGKRIDKLKTIEGQAPVLENSPSSCSFHPRCALALERCGRELPLKMQIRGSHDAACFLAKTEMSPANA